MNINFCFELEEVITGRLPNEKAELLAFAAKFSAS